MSPHDHRSTPSLYVCPPFNCTSHYIYLSTNYQCLDNSIFLMDWLNGLADHSLKERFAAYVINGFFFNAPTRLDLIARIKFLDDRLNTIKCARGTKYN
jgi:hypothetical protein